MDARRERTTMILLLMQVLTGLFAFTEAKCGRKPLDVIFVLDESGSIWGPDFRKQLKFVQDLVDQFDISPTGTRVGVETFGTEVRTIIELGEDLEAAQLKRHIDGITQLRGGTKTHLALERLREMFSRSVFRPEASRVAIVITDGESENPALTERAADGVHGDGIEVLAIGVGRTVKRAELERIASQPGFVFTVEDYNDLNSLLAILAVKACPPEEQEATEPAATTTLAPSTTKKTWPEPAPATRTVEWGHATRSTRAPDFSPIPKILEGCDSSLVFNLYFGIPDQMSVINTYLTMQFLRDITLLLNQSPSFIRPHLCPRACPPTNCIPPADSVDRSNQVEFLAELEGREAESATRCDLQLQYIQKQEEAYRRRHRADADDVRTALAILLIDNRLANLERLIREIDYSRRMGIQVIAVGVGDSVDPEELSKVASSARDLLYLSSYNYLPTIKDALAQRVCIRGLVNAARNSVLRELNWDSD